MDANKNTAAWVLTQISEGSIDQYLRVVVEAIKVRRETLLAGNALPGQLPCTPEDWQPPQSAAAKATATLKTGASRPAFYHKDHRPDPSLTPFQGRVPAVSPSAEHAVRLLGVNAYYDKSDIVGKCITTVLGGVETPVQIVGLGEKKVKVLLVKEPARGTYHGKKELHSIWEQNLPIFLEHSALLPWLA